MEEFFNTTHDLFSTINHDLSKQMDEAIKEGLKRKGYLFANDFELIEFIKNHCKRTIRTNGHVTVDEIFTVKDDPFMIYIPSDPISVDWSSIRGNKVTISTGQYQYL